MYTYTSSALGMGIGRQNPIAEDAEIRDFDSLIQSHRCCSPFDSFTFSGNFSGCRTPNFIKLGSQINRGLSANRYRACLGDLNPNLGLDFVLYVFMRES